MNNPVTYQLESQIARIVIDDGKRNALSPAVLKAIHNAFAQAEKDRAVVVVTGREEVFSAGFDLKVMKRGGTSALRMLASGYSLTARVLAHPYPVIAACNGHLMAMGVFLALAADYVLGAEGDFKISANEVALGMTMPRVAAAMLKHRLNPAAYQRAVTLAETFDPETARQAGFFDELTSVDDLLPRAAALAEAFKALEPRAHKASKRRIRRRLIRHNRLVIPLDLVDAVLLGIRGTRVS
ncbi:MAG: crotonase/enoyl-CoA hydratase family protein [Pseudomonadota bacterium]